MEVQVAGATWLTAPFKLNWQLENHAWLKCLHAQIPERMDCGMSIPSGGHALKQNFKRKKAV